MSLLHDYFNTRNLQGFQRLLDGSAERGQTASSAPSSALHGSSYTGGGGKSWTRSGGVASAANRSSVDVNARDWLGRTPLHLSCTSLESIEFTRALLKHPQIEINLPDVESLWTPLHRALYSANLPAALLLLQRSDIDASLKDLEGYTAYDLYNSTVDGTKPESAAMDAELFTWGANRNAALGVGDGDDRTFPDRVNIKSKEDPDTLVKIRLSARFSPIHVRQIQMSKLHTAVVTTESEGNLRLCGFGSGGRLGPAQHTQYNFKPLASFNLPVVRVALGQDHTLALSKSGEVYSWGLNRFSQLGYVVESTSTTTGRHEEPIQNVPKRVVGLLRREVVRGIAASKNASACWTNETVFTWGTNTGQLGYDKNAQPVQVLPRPVTKFTGPVIELAMSDTVLVALLATHNVECVWNDRHYRISFPLQAFPAGIQPYRPPQAIKDSRISKLTSCDDTFAALSSNGEVFTFTAPMGIDSSSGEGKGPFFKPQRVWALRKKFSAVKDVALGSDGSIIICTQSGHVFVRTRNAKSPSGKAFKFERVPYLQRVTQVCANSTGAFGALRIDYEPEAIQVTGNMIAEDLKTVQPYLKFYAAADENEDENVAQPYPDPGAQRRVRSAALASSLHFDDEPEDEDVEDDIDSILELCDVLSVEQRMRKAGGGSVRYEGLHLPRGADTMLHVQSGVVIPVHRVILAARSPVLEAFLSGSRALVDQKINVSLKLLPAKPGPGLGVSKLTRVSISGCHPLAVLIFLRYLYSDTLVAVWDRRVAVSVERELAALDANPVLVKADLQALAKLLELPLLAAALERPVKREPTPSMAQDMQRLFDAVQKGSLSRSSPLAPDVVIQLADRDVYTHSIILRARTPLFASFFDLEDWTVKRWAPNGMIRIDLKHLKWHVMRFVLGFMCCGQDVEMFCVLDFINSVDELLHFLFEVLAGANELLLDRLVLLCSSVILAHTNIHNACFVLAEATYYHVLPLVEKLQEYISVNLETFLEARILEEIPYAIVKQLAKFTKLRQTEKSPFSRSGAFAQELIKKHADWLDLQDFPETIVKSVTKGPLKKDGSLTKISPMLPTKQSSTQKMSPTNSPRTALHPPGLSSLPCDDIFIMDEPEPSPPSSARPEPILAPSVPISSRPVWKAHGAPRVDMKAVMAETASQQAALSRRPSAPNVQVSSRAVSIAKGPAPSTAAPSNSPMTKAAVKPGTSVAWRTTADPAAVGGAPATPPRPSNTPSVPSLPGSSGRPMASSSPNAGRPQAPSTPTRPPAPGLVITPTRQAHSKPGPSNSRVTSNPSTKAWVLPPLQPTTAPSPPTTGMSFIAIQHSQREQAPPAKDTRSLREIQEEEQSLQVEADFLKWWTAEEERLQQEALALAQFQGNLGKQGPRKPRSAKQKQDGKKRENSGPVLGDTPTVAPAAQNPDKRGQPHLSGRRPKKSSQKSQADS